MAQKSSTNPQRNPQAHAVAVHSADIKPLNRLIKAVSQLPWHPTTKAALGAMTVDSNGTITHGPTGTGTRPHRTS